MSSQTTIGAVHLKRAHFLHSCLDQLTSYGCLPSLSIPFYHFERVYNWGWGIVVKAVLRDCLLQSKNADSRFEELESVTADKDVSVSVDLEQISVESVEPQASDREGVIVVKLHNCLGVTQRHQTLFKQVEAKDLENQKNIRKWNKNV